MEKISGFLRQFGWIVLMGMVGVGILTYGLWGVMGSEDSVVEIVRGGTSNTGNSNLVIEENAGEKQVVVDVAGAVEKPGVYKLPSGSRIGDALVLAGGLAEKADRDWVSKTVNLAEVVKDGGKIYIPEKSDNLNTQKSGVPDFQKNQKININTASVAELDKLAGIGEVRAQAIVDNRPYGSTEELVSKAKVPESVYEKIKDQVSIY